jgi:anti-sigma B factor antagonist
VLTIEATEKKDVCIISLSGDLIFNEMEEADKVFMENISKKPRVIAMNCKHLKSLDSSGLGLFIKFLKEATKAKVNLVFYNITDHISTLFDVSKLDSMFDIMTESDFKRTYMD